jgi:type I restriction enzyme S subunit
MEVKPGYKQTELGVIPEEWDVESIEDAFAVCNQLRLPLSQTVRGRMAGPYPYYGPTSVQGWINEYRLEGEYALIGEDGDHFLKWQSQPMTLLVRGKFNVNNHAHLVRGTKNLTEWFYWFFANRDLTQYLTRQGAGRYKLTKAALLKIPCALPPPPEQRAIAEALSDVDGLLGGLDRLIAKKRDLKQAAMQQLLTGQTRLPGFHGEWVTKELGKLGKISGAGVDKKIRPGEPPVRLVNYMDVYRRKFIYSKDLDHVVSASVEQAARCAVRKGDVFFTPSSEMPFDIAVSAVAMEDILDACYSYHVVRLRLDEDWDLNFRAYAFKTQAFLDQAARTCEGSGVRYVITQGKFRQLTVRYPTDKAEQTAIAEVLTEMDLELAGLEQRREKTRALKQAMMQELLTGRTRLV